MVFAAKLRLQTLESRDCPAAPYVGNLTLQHQANHTAIIRGTVYDEAPEQTLVMIGGVADNTTASPLQNGFFIATVEVHQLGNIFIQALDNENLLSDLRSIVYGNAAPAIVSLNTVRISPNTWMISGTVEDEFAPGLAVRFTSQTMTELNSQAAIVDSNGHFQRTYTFSGKCVGFAAATVTDWWSETAEPVPVTVIP